MKVYVINLDRRTDRWSSFIEHWTNVEDLQLRRVRALEPTELSAVPVWWTSERGAWGCLHSHCAALEFIISNNEAGMVLEDDARMTEHFTENFWPFISALPENWEACYPGGELVGNPGGNSPELINDKVLRAHNVNRMHAYCVTPAGAQKMLTALSITEPWQRGVRCHCDWKIGQLHMSRELLAYVPHRWLITQGADGGSDIVVSRRRTGNAMWIEPAAHACLIERATPQQRLMHMHHRAPQGRQTYRPPITITREVPQPQSQQQQLDGPLETFTGNDIEKLDRLCTKSS